MASTLTGGIKPPANNYNLGEDELKNKKLIEHRTTGSDTAAIEAMLNGSTTSTTGGTTSTTRQPIATSSDVMSIWNQDNPGASVANASTLAQNQQDVDSMTLRDMLWDSANYTYGKQREESDRSYDQAMSQFNNQQLQRGMQRSSYGAATSANLANQKIKAQNDIYGAQIADYEKNVLNATQQEEAARQFDAQLNAQWLERIMKKGGDPSDEMLAAIGLSREDYNLMKKKKSSGGGGGGSSSSSGGGTRNPKKYTDPGDKFGDDTNASQERGEIYSAPNYESGVVSKTPRKIKITTF